MTSDNMYERAYFDIQEVLDEAIGDEWEDGEGAGIVADVALLAYRYGLAISALKAAGARTAADAISSATLPEPAADHHARLAAGAETTRCPKCDSPLSACATCGKPAMCGDAWCADCAPDEPVNLLAAGTEGG